MYKCKHYKRCSFFKIKINRRICVVLLSAVVLCFTLSPTYAYFTSAIDTIESGSGLSTLNIENGIVDIDVYYNDAKWVDSNENEIGDTINPQSGYEINYGPVYINVGDTNITTKVDMLSEYELTNEIDGDWSKGINPCEPFEVIVGDIDNFGFGALSDAYLDGATTDTHKLDIFPGEYDAKGTDRRMCPSNFYNYWYDYKTSTSFIDKKSEMGSGIYKFGSYYTESYTQRAAMKRNSSDTSTYSDSWMIDGRDWYSLQRSEPITFKYNEIATEKDIESVTFQIFTDDIQSGSATKGGVGITKFSQLPSRFSVYLIGKDSSGYEFKDKIDDFAKVINDYAQSGPKGNMRTLKLPSKYFNRIKEASGLDNGLKLLIDNECDGTEGSVDGIKGDSYAIDFAKMTINSAASSTSKVTISGKVTDNNDNAISGAIIYAEDGSRTTTSSNGSYSLATTEGNIKLKSSKDGYVDTIKDFGVFYSDTSINDKSLTGNDIEMSAIDNERYKVQIIATECDSEGNDKAVLKTADAIAKLEEDGTVVEKPIQLELSPNTKYKLKYKLVLNDKDSIDKNNNYKVGFHLNNIKIRGTQENNYGWLADGTGDEYQVKTYVNSKTPSNSNDEGEDSNAIDTRIYFEIPDTTQNDGSLWWKDIAPIINLVDNNSNNLEQINSVEKVDGVKWYVGQTNTKLSNSIIKVISGAEETYDGIMVKVHSAWKKTDLAVHVWDKSTGQSLSGSWNSTGEIIGKGISKWNNWSDSNDYRLKITLPEAYKSKEICIKFYVNNGSTYSGGITLPVMSKYADVTSCNTTNTTPDSIEYYNDISSGRLYYFNTRRVFICTN